MELPSDGDQVDADLRSFFWSDAGSREKSFSILNGTQPGRRDEEERSTWAMGYCEGMIKI